MAEAFDVDTQRRTEMIPETFALTLNGFRCRSGLRFDGGCNQLRHHQAFHVDARVVGALTGILRLGVRRQQFVDFRVHTLLLFESIERIEIQKCVIGNDAAGSAWTADFTVEGRRVTHQARANLEVTQYVGAAVFDAHRFAFVQACAALAVLDTVAAGVGEKERTLAVADNRVVIGQVTLAVRDDPVAVLTPPDHAAGLFKGLLAQLGGHELLGVQHFENQFHV
ncbi:hypothetical protein D3C81_1435950 [compost metagenome]